jgi:hypothetical protein
MQTETTAGPSTPHPSDEDLSLGTPTSLRSAQDDKLNLADVGPCFHFDSSPLLRSGQFKNSIQNSEGAAMLLLR